MGWLSNIFKKKNIGGTSYFLGDDSLDTTWEDIVFHRENLVIDDPIQRRNYIEGCLQQILDAEKELSQLHYEYSVVTSHLTDMEELESLPKEQLAKLREVASNVVTLESKQETFKKSSRMDDETFERIAKREDEIPEGIRKMQEAEDYQKLVKADLRRLHVERMTYHDIMTELEDEVDNYTGIAKMCFIAMAVCLILLVGLQITLGFDVRLGYVLLVSVMALVILYAYTRHTEATRELAKTQRDNNKLILLQNTVKIRYVNNKNLLDYLHLKFKVERAEQLRRLWEDYQQEREERELMLQTSQDYTYYQRELLKHLRLSSIRDTSVWLHQAAAIVDPKEMVELRHELIGRRQALREQMEHNQKLAASAKDELADLSKTYPRYAQEILHAIERYEKKA